MSFNALLIFSALAGDAFTIDGDAAIANADTKAPVENRRLSISLSLFLMSGIIREYREQSLFRFTESCGQLFSG